MAEDNQLHPLAPSTTYQKSDEMAEDNQLHPLAPSTTYQKSDEEFAIATYRKQDDPKSSKFFVYVLTGVVITSAILLIFSSIFLRVTSPKIRLRSAEVGNLMTNNGSGSASSSLSMTINGVITIKNTNFGRYEFESSMAGVLYGINDTRVGEGRIGKGRVIGRGTEKVKVSMDVRILEEDTREDNNGTTTTNTTTNNGLKRDMDLGIVEMTSYNKISGRVHLINMFKRRKSAELNCTMSLNLITSVLKVVRCN